MGGLKQPDPPGGSRIANRISKNYQKPSGMLSYCTSFQTGTVRTAADGTAVPGSLPVVLHLIRRRSLPSRSVKLESEDLNAWEVYGG